MSITKRNPASKAMVYVIYDGTLMCGWLEGDTAGEAFRTARHAVKALAHSAGESGPELIEYPRGRVSIGKGSFRATLWQRQDRAR